MTVQPKSNVMKLDEYACGCVWEWSYEYHWRPTYCKMHQEMAIKEHDKIN